MTTIYPEPIRDPFAARGKLTPPGAEAMLKPPAQKRRTAKQRRGR